MNNDLSTKFAGYAERANESKSKQTFHLFKKLSARDQKVAQLFLLAQEFEGKGGRGLTTARLKKNAIQFTPLSQLLEVPFETLIGEGEEARKAGQRFLSKLANYKTRSGKEAAPWTKHDLVILFRQLVNFLNGNRANNRSLPVWCEKIRPIKGHRRTTDTLEDKISPDEVEKFFIAHTVSLSEKAFLKFSHVYGPRGGEGPKMKIKHILATNPDGTFDIRVPKGKTVERDIVVSHPGVCKRLQDWLEVHPDRNNPEAPLWFSLQGKPLTAAAYAARLKTLAKQSGFTKKHTPTAFRKSAITHARINGLAQDEAEYLFGSHVLEYYDASGLEKHRSKMLSAFGKPSIAANKTGIPQTLDELAEALFDNPRFQERFNDEIDPDGKKCVDYVFDLGAKLYEGGLIDDEVEPPATKARKYSELPKDGNYFDKPVAKAQQHGEPRKEVPHKIEVLVEAPGGNSQKVQKTGAFREKKGKNPKNGVGGGRL